jgi:hypothetical protein
MAVNDVMIKAPAQFGTIGTKRYAVAAGATAILAGELVAKPLGASSVLALGNAMPVVSTDFVCGLAESASTQTASAAGTVDVIPLVTNVVYTIRPNNSTTFGLSSTPVQATYDALVGDRVVIDVTSGNMTILSTDGATNGLVIEPTDVTKAQGRVSFSVRAAANYLA